MNIAHIPRLRSLLTLCLGCCAVLLGACSTLEHGAAPQLERQATWAVLPFANHTETPLAGQRAESIAEALLRARSQAQVRRYPAASTQEALFEASEQKLQDDALIWARQQGARYALTGAVDEWRYKVGVDGEPAVGVTLEIVEVGTGATVWSGAGAQSGWSREALAAVGQKLIRNLLGTGLANAR